MVLTESSSLPIGTVAPDFELPDPRTGEKVTFADIKGPKATLVMIICNHCPFVVLLKKEIAKLAAEYQQLGVGVVAISANSVKTHPQDGPEAMAVDAEENLYTFPYLYDETQETAKAYRALCTPEFLCFDSEAKLRYHGRFDNARPGKSDPVTGSDVRAALDAIINGGTVPEALPSVGCSIKWHPGNEPASG